MRWLAFFLFMILGFIVSENVPTDWLYLCGTQVGAIGLAILIWPSEKERNGHVK
jgi:hypothetical protein